ncbi:MAG: phosphatase PAP2 family protein [Bryobacteraceae bacterium]
MIFARAKAQLHCLQAGERVAAIFFLYLFALAWVRQLGMAPRLLLLILPLLICGLATVESGTSRPWSRVVRDWLSMGLILVGYWSIGWFSAPPIVAWQERWVGWDRTLLDAWGLRAAIESAGYLIPSLLEVTYLLLYALPMVCMCVLYWIGGRERVHRFLFTLLLGTFSAYALLPLLPVHGPHLAYPGFDLPNVHGLGRSVNVWILDQMDIPTSVFPSGHVAVAFSTAFGMYRAVRTRPAIWGAVFGAACLIYAATIYCRYHYAVDGLASVLIVAAASMAIPRGHAVA